MHSHGARRVSPHGEPGGEDTAYQQGGRKSRNQPDVFPRLVKQRLRRVPPCIAIEEAELQMSLASSGRDNPR
jgi:hypothetical protein